MSDRLPLAVLEERDDLALPPGTAWSVQYVDPAALSRIYPEAIDAIRRRQADLVAEHARNNGHPQVTRDDVTLTEVTADELRDAWKRRHTPMEPLPPDLDAWVGYWTPPEVHP